VIGGWGFLLGDQGSGARIGRAACEAALLAHDGLAAATPLLAGLLADHGGPSGLVAFGRRANPADFARLVPRVIAAEAASDPAGRAVMAEAEAAVAAAVDRLEADGPLPVCFLGGLGPELARRLAPRYPGMIRPPLGTGLDAALAMARGVLA
jgi:glucosamine kinase